ncbi:hypothetical protein ACRALDRAFT_211369 [Sodiomyces alcalophilus JCM 7366]|uniref:uncharacterized protein n=1 Tax=Sodiomyces alcalophilus JCM 7366 TaxID=591952 RepID=UPI0039B40B39
MWVTARRRNARQSPKDIATRYDIFGACSFEKTLIRSKSQSFLAGRRIEVLDMTNSASLL